MTSSTRVDDGVERAFVWVWLPGSTEPVVAGVVEYDRGVGWFTYGRSYLARDDAIALYGLGLVPGRQRDKAGGPIPACLTDSMPDSWGQRIILRRRLGTVDTTIDHDVLSPVTYMLESGSDRVGAIDFQATPEEWVPRTTTATLEELVTAAARIDAGLALPEALDAAIRHGTSIGGARPKVTIDDDGRGHIAKLSSSTDIYPVVQAEALAMDLAATVGLDVAPSQLIECAGRDVLLVERFDRTDLPGERRMVTSAMTVLDLWEMTARHGTYYDLADRVRARFGSPKSTLRELFARIVFNVLVGNHDDHARNHAAFWDGTELSLTPAYDLCPQVRSVGEVHQALAFAPGVSRSQLVALVDAAAIYQLNGRDARQLIDDQVEAIATNWDAAATQARLSDSDRNQMWGRQFLHPYAFQDYGPNPAA
ncbi:MAG: HipA domain-containing protein [Acidimicrobiia bacterium]|nr:HipA domain-containing protein [Acidimicrobiia bacterium]